VPSKVKPPQRRRTRLRPEAPEPKPPESGGPETNSSPARKRRPVSYMRSFRGEALGGGPSDGTTAVVGGTQPVSRFMVTLMVQERKLTGGVMRHFPHPSCHFGAKALLQTSGLSEQVAVFGHFLGYQILPNFTNFDQKRAANGSEGGR